MPRKPNTHTDRYNRQRDIETMEIGETLSISYRIDLSFGIPDGAVQLHTDRVRSTLDAQATRAKKKIPGRQYVVENGHYISAREALIITAALTRTA